MCIRIVQAYLYSALRRFFLEWSVYCVIRIAAEIKVKTYLFLHHSYYYLKKSEALRLFSWATSSVKIVLRLWICLHFIRPFLPDFLFGFQHLWTVLLKANLFIIYKNIHCTNGARWCPNPLSEPSVEERFFNFSTYLEPMLQGNHYFQPMLLKIWGFSQKVKIEFYFFIIFYYKTAKIFVFLEFWVLFNCARFLMFKID